MHHSNEYDDARVYDPSRNTMNTFLQLPFPHSDRCAYFLMHAPDLRSLAIAKSKGTWLTSSKVINEMNHSLNSVGERVLVFFSVAALKGIYGIAMLTTTIPAPSTPTPTEFPIQWLRCMRISIKLLTLSKVNIIPSAVTGRVDPDARLDRSVGYELMLVGFRKPEWDWTADMDKITPFALPFNGTLPDTVLFGEDWIRRASEIAPPPPPPERRPNDNYDPSRNNRQKMPPAPPANKFPNDYYTGDIPGFIFTAKPSMFDEIFARFLLGLPAQLMVSRVRCSK
jgi:hypothetical protein